LKFRPEVRQLETTLLLCAPHYWGWFWANFLWYHASSIKRR